MTNDARLMSAARKVSILERTVFRNPFIPIEHRTSRPDGRGITHKQIAFLMLDCEEALFGGAAGGGKALPLDTPIPTPTGWTNMVDLRPGDEVFAPDGSICTVQFRSAVMIGNECRRLKFSDGSSMVADVDHLWVTMTDAERTAALRRTDQFRATRRAVRPRRGTGKRDDVAWNNSIKKYTEKSLLDPCGGSLRTTAEIEKTLIVRGARINHSIDLCKPLELKDRDDLALDPYLLGLWLGDGTTASGSITTADEEIVNAFRSEGFDVVKWSDPYSWGVGGLSRILRSMGLMKKEYQQQDQGFLFGGKEDFSIPGKFIPKQYLRASVKQRIALLQGLMDTDGYCSNGRGRCEFTTTSPVLADDFKELVLSLGINPNIREGVAKLNGRVVSKKWTALFMSPFPAFRLERKVRRQKTENFRNTVCRRYIVEVEKVESVPVCCIKVSSESGCFLAGRDMIPTHNTDSLLMAALQYVHVPNYSALILRRTYSDLALSGAIMDRAMNWLANTPAIWSSQLKRWTFPSGATLTFGYCRNDEEAQRYKSAEYQFIGIDELTEWGEKAYTFLGTRKRRLADSEVPIRVRAATNPGGRGHEWVKQRFIVEGKKHGRAFVPASLADNPNLDVATYTKTLKESLIHDPILLAQVLGGDWNVRQAGSMFKREFIKPDHYRDARIGGEVRRVRHWDLAATEDDKADWTASCLGSIGPERIAHVEDVTRFRKTPGARDEIICATAALDGKEVEVSLEEEGGSGGKAQVEALQKKLAGYRVVGRRVKSAKPVRFGPFCSYAEAGLIRVVRGPWNLDWMTQLEAFPQVEHDDMVDATSGMFSALTGGPSPEAFLVKSKPVERPRPTPVAAKFNAPVGSY